MDSAVGARLHFYGKVFAVIESGNGTDGGAGGKSGHAGQVGRSGRNGLP